MYYIYILYSKKYNRFYTGMTNNIDRRVQEHNSGQSKVTKSFSPWIIVYSEKCQNRENAREREKYWKSGVGGEKRSKLII